MARPPVTTALIACDKFKGSLTAAQVCAAVEAGIRKARPGTNVIATPVTGEGSLDLQTLNGKAVAGVAAAAWEARVPTVAVCGQGLLGPGQLAGLGISQAYALSDREPDVARCISDAAALLESAAEQLAREWIRKEASLPG